MDILAASIHQPNDSRNKFKYKYLSAAGPTVTRHHIRMTKDQRNKAYNLVNGGAGYVALIIHKIRNPCKGMWPLLFRRPLLVRTARTQHIERTAHLFLLLSKMRCATTFKPTAALLFRRLLFTTNTWQYFPVEWRWQQVLHVCRGALADARGAKHESQWSSSSGVSALHILHFQVPVPAILGVSVVSCRTSAAAAVVQSSHYCSAALLCRCC